jgi:hypothetical protein
MNRRMPGAALTALAWLAALTLPADASGGGESEPLFHMAVLSDRTGGHVPGVYERVIDEINLLGPDIVVTVGDHIEGYGDDFALVRAEWDSLLPVIGRLRAPVHLTPGNHDIWSDAAEPVYVEMTGQRPYSSFDYRGVHFVILDTGRWESAEELPAAQMDWLAGDLAANAGAARTFVFFHKPYWEQRLPVGRPDAFHDLFVKHGVDAVFNGHYHTTINERFDGIDYTVVGSSGGAMSHADDSVPRGEFYQFGWVTVWPDEHQVAIVDLGGVYPFGVVTETVREEVARVESAQVSVTPVPVYENAPAGAEVVVTVANASPEAIDDVLVWTVPDGWVVDPVETRVAVSPGATEQYSFTAMNPGALYPTPGFSFEYPLSDGRRLDLDVPLRAVRTASASRCDAPPRVDGVLDDPCWREAAAISNLFPPYAEAVEGETRVAFAYDSENLYVSAACADPAADRIVAAVSDRDGAVYGEDCVGFFIQPDLDVANVFQVYWNALGTAFDQTISFNEAMIYTTDRAWNGEYEAVGARGADGWVLEARVPLSSIGGKAEPGAAWGLNFRRKQARTGASANWQVPIDYDPRSFGRLAFR